MGRLETCNLVRKKLVGVEDSFLFPHARTKEYMHAKKLFRNDRYQGSCGVFDAMAKSGRSLYQNKGTSSSHPVLESSWVNVYNLTAQTF